MFGLDKPLGLTSLQALDALRAADPALRDRRLGHAGRLDPMAEGLLTVLVDDETRDVVPDFPLDDGSFARACRAWEGAVAQRYPPFSQARVAGRSLLAWGAAGLAMERPVATRTIASITALGRRVEAGEAIVAEAVRRAGLVRGELRQEAIAARWRAQEAALAGRSVTVVSLRVACSAGTYMRSLAHDLGAAVGAPSIAWRIRRTRAGELRVEDARRLP
jgi:tRNA pseudouridine55 synthase